MRRRDPQSIFLEPPEALKPHEELTARERWIVNEWSKYSLTVGLGGAALGVMTGFLMGLSWPW